METWLGVTWEKWYSGFQLTQKDKKVSLTRLRKMFTVWLVCLDANKHRDRIIDEADTHDKG
ncbi:hypothetical protein HanIR_Chr07g0300331 [Helianthus annuus]|nr:hypothetical protein HanIR_Chr07g0300331 [Helianthus annuus]